MQSSFKPVAFDRHGRRRTRATLPRWLVLLLLGVGVGAAGVVYVQERHLPPRLSYDASTRLQQSFERAEAERVRLMRELAETGRQLESALTQNKTLADRFVDSERRADALAADVATLVAALPPDPRGGVVAVRSGRFRATGGTLSYDVLLTRDGAAAKPLAARMQVVVSGQGPRGGDSSVSLPPVVVSIGTHQSLSGELSLPSGFEPQQATVRIVAGSDGALLGQRVLYVR